MVYSTHLCGFHISNASVFGAAFLHNTMMRLYLIHNAVMLVSQFLSVSVMATFLHFPELKFVFYQSAAWCLCLSDLVNTLRPALSVNQTLYVYLRCLKRRGVLFGKLMKSYFWSLKQEIEGFFFWNILDVLSIGFPYDLLSIPSFG